MRIEGHGAGTAESSRSPHSSSQLLRLVVIGVSGCGKTTLAQQLAQNLSLPHVELDALYWEEKWQPASRPVFRGRVQAATAEEAWVVDGNYSQSRDIVWSRATDLVWLDYGLTPVMGRVIRRTARRLISQQELWNGNRESLRNIFGRNSIIWYAFTSHRRHRKKYIALLNGEDFRHMNVYRFNRPQEASRWLQSLLQPNSAAPQ
ncbi:MAG: AAA family ATPase [Caldilineaceae bacterium]|nr:AAA family ATPase [Caldilineaceae bacterium]